MRLPNPASRIVNRRLSGLKDFINFGRMCDFSGNFSYICRRLFRTAPIRSRNSRAGALAAGGNAGGPCRSGRWRTAETATRSPAGGSSTERRCGDGANGLFETDQQHRSTTEFSSDEKTTAGSSSAFAIVSHAECPRPQIADRFRPDGAGPRDREPGNVLRKPRITHRKHEVEPERPPFPPPTKK